MASLSTCHLGLWLGWQILLNLVKQEEEEEEEEEEIMSSLTSSKVRGVLKQRFYERFYDLFLVNGNFMF